MGGKMLGGQRDLVEFGRAMFACLKPVVSSSFNPLPPTHYLSLFSFLSTFHLQTLPGNQAVET